MHRILHTPAMQSRREGPLAVQIGAVEAATELFAAPPPVESLVELASAINAAHADAQEHANKAMDRALAAGDLLNSVKAQLKHGEFGSWCKLNCPAISRRTIQDYMRVARELPDEMRNAAYLSLNEARRIVSGDNAAEPEPEPLPAGSAVESNRLAELESTAQIAQLTTSIGADGKEYLRQVERKPEPELLIPPSCSRSPTFVLNDSWPTPEPDRIDFDQLLESHLSELPRGWGKTKDKIRKTYRAAQNNQAATIRAALEDEYRTRLEKERALIQAQRDELQALRKDARADRDKAKAMLAGEAV